ncbi:MAG: PAS domain S-box protein [Deltaproteobacteria bacterium]|nr:PAS domain S-box protein [Deltaproteobacteria bacterium]
MNDETKTKQELIGELAALRQRIAALERLELPGIKPDDTEEQYRSLFEISTSAILIFDPDSVITMLNGAALRLLGASGSDEVRGRRYLDFVHPEDRPLSAERIENIFQAVITPDPSGGSHAAILPREHRLINLRGEVIYVESTGVGFRHQGEILIQAIYRDITTQKQAEFSLRESESRFRMLIENAPFGVSIITLAGKILYLNHRATQLLECPLEDVIDRELVHKFWVNPEQRAAWREEVLKRGIVADYEVQLQTVATHKHLWILLSGMITEYRGQRVILATHHDITDRKRLESQFLQAQKMEAIGTLAAGIAHDFNNLLMGMQGYTSLMLMDLDPSHLHHDRLKHIEDQIRSGAELTKQLLGFAQGGRYDVKSIDMNTLLSKSSSIFSRTKKELTVCSKLAEDLWTIEADAGQMEQILMNLYVNAWQAMPEGGELLIETRNVHLSGAAIPDPTLPPGRYILVNVADTGMGMNENTKQRIFDPFFTTKGMGRGTGLGLATVYGIVKGHGGTIQVASEPGRGTAFSIYLPASEKAVVKETPLSQDAVQGHETILLVDDESMVIQITKELIEALGYQVYLAASGQEALAVFMEKRQEIDLVILDMIMPGISGGETFDRLRKIEPAVRVLLSSGYSITGQAQEILNRGCNGFLQKPFKLENLSGKVREILDAPMT